MNPPKWLEPLNNAFGVGTGIASIAALIVGGISHFSLQYLTIFDFVLRAGTMSLISTAILVWLKERTGNFVPRINEYDLSFGQFILVYDPSRINEEWGFTARLVNNSEYPLRLYLKEARVTIGITTPAARDKFPEGGRILARRQVEQFGFAHLAAADFNPTALKLTGMLESTIFYGHPRGGYARCLRVKLESTIIVPERLPGAPVRSIAVPIFVKPVLERDDAIAPTFEPPKD